ncbi:MAG TPA: hypothetical protein VKE70_38750, partial [Candidatus Solibacter sp.]|nr:hypothetical protein [Candidatus Solibacter sp.]
SLICIGSSIRERVSITMTDNTIMRPGFNKEAYAAGHAAFLETLSVGLPVFYLDDGVELMEQPDGRRSEIRWIPDLPADKNFEIVREVGRRVADSVR